MYFFQASKRLMTRRSLIASEILKTVMNLFSGVEYAGNPTKIVAHPMPAECRVVREHPAYIKPRGFLQSDYVLIPACAALRRVQKSIIKPPISVDSPPKGLITLILTVTERAFGAYLNGSYTELADFKHDNYWNQLKGHMDNINDKLCHSPPMTSSLMSYDVTMPYIPVDSLSDVVYRLVVDQYDPPPDYQLGFWATLPLTAFRKLSTSLRHQTRAGKSRCPLSLLC
ncbi:hypothetical protein CPB83DRAFT_884650 [Crepidotus variabilis]|uniref:Uncharacterized protein n=1 Tax=Crepidotus variabilis TaxID=179855 RepID=A0A9P6ED90_9AGAR|nr:hypothetical protein CPB83DRAFT_884650 [Crepidotus variabilis]